MNRIIGNRLKFLRRNKGMSQEQVADYLHVSQSAYARMESGESHSWAIHFKEICRLFAVSPEELVKVERVLKEENLNPDLISVKLIEQYEQRIIELKETIENLKDKKR
ncbi:helix-turn-helix transcriptional regulator [Flavobacterium geliluteum]|uniref:Helix-turn-helix transcriptional regulator n=1 Tax=Flavobacterium geliluteum TaxID=2816120 RepID=A0A941AYR4_9FLAO|nr:helix-turn-helix transcriptional regulator [Flavobacterium geliluteum]MBP4138087.1 helix-turn-helix transcriptional regulator [Flavobacterium geliluteum]